jgi:hypothetical protein
LDCCQINQDVLPWILSNQANGAFVPRQFRQRKSMREICERQFEMIGEALGQFANKVNQQLARRIASNRLDRFTLVAAVSSHSRKRAAFRVEPWRFDLAIPSSISVIAVLPCALVGKFGVATAARPTLTRVSD